MARFKSNLISTGSGKLGGTVISHNRYGDYLRGWKKGVNPRRPLQIVIRAIFAAVSGAWAALTLAQQSAWRAAAQATPVRDRKMGGTMILTGNAFYCRSNVPRLQAGLLRVDPAPTVNELPTFTMPHAVAATGTNTLALSALATSDAWQGSTSAGLLVSASPLQNPGVNFYGGPYQYVGKVSGSTTTATASLTLPFSTPATSGSKIFLSVRSTLSDGRLSDSQQLAVVVGAV